MEGAPVNDFTHIKLQKLDIVCEQSLKAGKYVIMFDKTGNCETYFNYKATMREF